MTKEFGDYLENLRRAAGLTQMDLANQSGVKNSQISHVESGNSGLSYRKAAKLADALDIPIGKQPEFFLLSYGCPRPVVDLFLQAMASDPQATRTIKAIKDLIDGVDK